MNFKLWFRKALIVTALPAVLCAQSTVVPPNTVLEWDDPNPENSVAEYRMYCVSASPVEKDPANLRAQVAYPTTQWTITMLSGSHVCAVTCYGAGGVDSELSNELSFTVGPARPVNFRIRTPE